MRAMLRSRCGRWVATTAACAFVTSGLVLGVASASRALSATNIILDARGSGWYEVDDVARQVETDCKGITDRVSLKIVAPHRSYGDTFNCVDVNGHPASVVPQLLDLAAKQPGVQRRANRVAAIDSALPADQRVGYDVNSMLWSMAAGFDGRCGSADDLKQIRTDLATAANKSPGPESPERWTLIEAVYIAGACPQQLPTLFRSVARLGHADAATAVRETIKQARDSIK